MPFFTSIALFLKSPFGKLLQLDDSIVGGGTDDHKDLVDKTGKALTDLHPGGKALIDGQRVDVLAQTGYISAGDAIKVVKIDGGQVTVKSMVAKSPSPRQNPENSDF